MVELSDGWWKVGRIRNQSVQLFREPSRKTPPKWARLSLIKQSMHVGKWYQVLSLEHAVKSPRQWGINPEGRIGLTLDTRFHPPRVRTLIGPEILNMSIMAFDPSTSARIRSGL